MQVVRFARIVTREMLIRLSVSSGCEEESKLRKILAKQQTYSVARSEDASRKRIIPRSHSSVVH